MTSATTDHYATLGLARNCTGDEIRKAYRLLTKRHHPDVNGGSEDAVRRSQEINAAYEVLSDPARRRAYDQELPEGATPPPPRRAKPMSSIKQDAHLRLADFLNGTRLDVRVDDPGHPGGAETYELEVPADTAPGTRFRIPRTETGFVEIRVKAMPGGRLKVKGSDVQCDLRVQARTAKDGGREMVTGITGRPVWITIPRGVARGELVRVPGEGLPKPRGGRGDLVARIIYRPEVRVTRAKTSGF